MEQESEASANALGEASLQEGDALADKPTIPCPVCGNAFTPTRFWQKYCSTKCRNDKFWSTHERLTVKKKRVTKRKVDLAQV